jgi:hypothetical protein
MKRNTLIAVILILVAFTALILGDHYGLITRSGSDPSAIVRRWPTVPLGYCNAANIKPCIVSFNRMEEGGMEVGILLPSTTYPDFYLMVRRGGGPITYACEKADALQLNAYCTGVELLPGEPLHFMLIALGENTLLAEGQFAIIGVMLATPEAEPTATVEQPAPTEPTAIALQTPTAPEIFILPPATMSPTPDPSYPNPSYPNPSYPNP